MFKDNSIIFSHKSSYDIPTAAASCGSKLVGVIPGSVFASKQYGSFVSERIKSILEYTLSPNTLYAFSAKRCIFIVLSLSKLAGQTSSVRPA